MDISLKPELFDLYSNVFTIINVYSLNIIGEC